MSGAKADRRELLKLLNELAPGDVVTATRIDRLARSTFDLFVIVKCIVDAGWFDGALINHQRSALGFNAPSLTSTSWAARNASSPAGMPQ